MAKLGYLVLANKKISKSDIEVKVFDTNSKTKKQSVEYMLKYFKKKGDYYVPRYLTMFNDLRVYAARSRRINSC
jgi:hypothetical protein